MTATFPHICVFTALLPASTKLLRPGFAKSFHRMSDTSSRMVTTWAVASSRANYHVCKWSRGLTGQVRRTILAGLRGRVLTITHGGAVATITAAVGRTMSLPDDTGARQFRRGLLLEGAAVLLVAPAA
jgi:hypothetical protein